MFSTTSGSANNLNLGWGMPPWPVDRIDQLGLDLRQRAGKLSGGERAQLALTLALAKQPELLILDEPIASLDPLARSEFLRSLADFTACRQIEPVAMSSHLVSDLERVCDYLIVLVASRVQVAGPVAELLASHGQGLEDLVLGYMRRASPSRTSHSPPAHSGGMTMIWLAWRQFRTQAIAAAAALALLAILLALTGPHLADLYDGSGLAPCTGASPAVRSATASATRSRG